MSETNNQSSDVSFQVMPHSNGANYTQTSPGAPSPAGSGGSGSKLPYFIIAVVVLLLLGGLAYYFIGFDKLMFWQKPAVENPPVEHVSKLPKQFLSENFGMDTCETSATCGDGADPDKDGLTNYQEFVSGTMPLKSDTDLDGLADGDELNIYGTQPNNQFTDTRAIAEQNGFNDSVSIKNGYDPTTPGAKFTETRLQSIQSKIAQFTLHEPTMAALGLNSDGSTASNASQ